MHDPDLFTRHHVPQLDIKNIFEKATGRPVNQETRTVVTHTKSMLPEINGGRTLSGKMKPGAFTIAPSRRREQFFV